MASIDSVEIALATSKEVAMANPSMPGVSFLMVACLTSWNCLLLDANLMFWGDLKRFGLAASFASRFRFACFFFLGPQILHNQSPLHLNLYR